MAKFKVTFSCSTTDEYQKSTKDKLEKIYHKYKDYFDTLPNDITINFRTLDYYIVAFFPSKEGKTKIENEIDKIKEILHREKF